MENPGLLYVAATLLPLASFLLLLLGGGLRAAAKPFRDTPLGGTIFRGLGGDAPIKTGAYIATGAIGLAFVLSLIGFILFKQDHPHETIQHTAPPLAAVEHAAGGDVVKDWRVSALTLSDPSRWSVSVDWASLNMGSRPATSLSIGYRIDSLATVMFLMVTFIATLIHIFSIGYMADELQPTVEDHQVHTADGHLRRRGRFGRFFLFLSLFCFSMLNLILADNLFQVFLSWELVGICSYLLVGFYYERSSASNAAIKAFVTNRVGDAGFIIGLLILWTYVGTLDFEEVFRKIRLPENDIANVVTASSLRHRIVRAAVVPGEAPSRDGQKLQISAGGDQVVLFPEYTRHSEEVRKALDTGIVDAKFAPRTGQLGSMPYWVLVVAGLGIFLGCVGKSAQFPLHVWLPDAMEGPTPVSALIHAATMVAAGVYLVGRCFPLFTPEARLVIAYTGGITLFMAATIAIVQTDIKKVLAYSTVSQLGYMMLALGVGGWIAGLFHLITHAFFKALLFLGSGSVIYGCHHEQDMTKMGGLYPKMKVTAITMLVGMLTIAGIPLFSGWYSKDAILAQALGFVQAHPKHILLFLLPLLTAGITAFYMFRLWLLTFAGKPRDEHVYEHAHESPRTMTVPLIILAVCSVAVAWGWPLYDAEASVLNNTIEQSEPLSAKIEFAAVHVFAHGSHALAGNLALGLVLVALIFASLIYHSGVLDPEEAKQQFPGIHRFLWNKWYVDELYSAIIVRPALTVAHWCRKFDTRVIDGTVDATARGVVQLSRWDGRFDLGIIDGLVNLTARVVFAVGGRLRTVQTGYLRSYILFLVLAAIGIFAVLSYFVAFVRAG
jgi:NADH-quinone oxidoreductase subunit L